MSYKPAYIWNGTGWDQIGNQVVDTLEDYALLNPSASANQTITNTTLSGNNNTFSNIPQSAVVGLDGAYAPFNISIENKTSSYTLVLTDAAKQIEMNVGSANTLTVPTNSSVPFPIGTVIVIVQSGSGQTTLAGAGGVTVNATPGLKLRTQWSVATLTKRGADTWLAAGDLIA